MSTLPEDIHSSAYLVASIRTLHPLLSATGVGVLLRQHRWLGTICSADQRSQSLARSSHDAALGLSQSGWPVLLREGLVVVAAHPADFFACTHHPCLGLDGGRA